MKSARIFIFFTLVLAACSGDDAVSDVPSSAPTSAATVSSSSTTTTTSPLPASAGALLVQSPPFGDEPLRLIAPDGEPIAALRPPPGFGDQLLVTRVLWPQNAPTAVVATPEGLATVDLATYEVRPLAVGAALEWVAPDERYAVFSVGSSISVLDVAASAVFPVGEGERVADVSAAGTVISVGILDAELRRALVDVRSGVVARPEGSAEPILDDSGDRFFRIRSNLGQQTRDVVVASVDSSAETEVWATDDGLGAYAWGADGLIAARPSGSVVLLTPDGELEIGVVPIDAESPRLQLHGDRHGPNALLRVQTAESRSWFHVDVSAQLVRPLDAAAGLDLSVTIGHPSGYLVLDDRVDDGGFDISRAVAVRLANGSLTEVVSRGERRTVWGGPVGETHLVTGIGRDDSLRIVDLEDGFSFAIEGGASAVASPGGAHFAVSSPAPDGNLVDRLVMVYTRRGDAATTVAEGLLVGWIGLPEAG